MSTSKFGVWMLELEVFEAAVIARLGWEDSGTMVVHSFALGDA